MYILLSQACRTSLCHTLGRFYFDSTLNDLFAYMLRQLLAQGYENWAPSGMAWSLSNHIRDLPLAKALSVADDGKWCLKIVKFYFIVTVCSSCEYWDSGFRVTCECVCRNVQNHCLEGFSVLYLSWNFRKIGHNRRICLKWMVMYGYFILMFECRINNRNKISKIFNCCLMFNI